MSERLCHGRWWPERADAPFDDTPCAVKAELTMNTSLAVFSNFLLWCSRIATNGAKQSPPFVLFNLVVVVKRAFVDMAGDLKWSYASVVRLSSVVVTSQFVVEWSEIRFSWTFRDFARVSTMLPILCSPILDLAYQTLVFGPCIIAKFKGPEVCISNKHLLRNSPKSRRESLWPPSLRWFIPSFIRFVHNPLDPY